MEDTIFYLNLKKNPDKLEVFKKAFDDGLIQNFDPEVLTKLRKMYYGCYSGLLYLYLMPSTSSTIGSKVEILAHVFSDFRYSILHGDIDSTREIFFHDYGSEELDYNSWIEVPRGMKIWVYDLFSMLKFERNVYYKLEKPTINKIVSSESLKGYPQYEETDFSHFKDHFMIIYLMSDIERNLKKSPYKRFLEAELNKFKAEIHYQDILLEWKREEKIKEL